MPHSSQIAVLFAVALAVTLAGFAIGCAHRGQNGAQAAYGYPLSEDDDLGDPRDAVAPRPEPTIEEMRAQEGTQELTFDGLEPNDGPTQMVQSDPERPPMPSMLPSVLTGPSGAAPR